MMPRLSAIVKEEMLLAKDEERACLIQEIMAKHKEIHEHVRLYRQVCHRPFLEAQHVNTSVLVPAVLLGLAEPEGTIRQAGLLLS